jgi:glycosyltransferase involved in cell wall biosynthesis
MVVREAMAHGRPVVASDVGGLRDAVQTGVDGLLVPAKDPAALRSAIERLLDDPELRAQLGSAAREKAGHEWSRVASAAAHLATYHSALGRG